MKLTKERLSEIIREEVAAYGKSALMEGWVLHRSGKGDYYIGGDDYGKRSEARVFEFEEQARGYADHIKKKEGAGYHLVPEEA